ncbi:MAG TPA: hypothetical protein VEI01_02660 [Terriglobales bacterium]|nr:hypothetical protein [Terriglobales bacterium]
MGGLAAGVKTSVVPSFLSRLYSVPTLDWWWVRVPARLRRYSVTLSTAWADGLYLTAWPRLAVLLPMLAALVGVALGASHWSPYVIGDNSISTTGPIIVFAESLPFLFVAVVLGSLSAHLGLMLTFGYMIGEYLIAGPATAIWGYNSAWPLFFGERLPLLLCYWLLFILAARTTLTSNALAASLLRSPRGNDAATKVLRVGTTAVFQFALVYAWAVAAPMIIRIVWIWTGHSSSPFTVPGYLDLVGPWVPLSAAAAVVLRGFLMHRALRHEQVMHRLHRLKNLSRFADLAPAFSRRMPPWLRALIAAAALTFLISGLLLSFEYTAGMFVIFAVILLLRALVLPKMKVWITWSRTAARVPLAARLSVAVFLAFLISRFIVSVPGRLDSQGKFGIELICLAIGLPIMLLLAANGEGEGSSSVISGGSRGGHPIPSNMHSVTKAAGTAVLLFCVFGASKAYASCVDDSCCLVTLGIAALLIALLLALAILVILPMMGVELLAIAAEEAAMAEAGGLSGAIAEAAADAAEADAAWAGAIAEEVGTGEAGVLAAASAQAAEETAAIAEAAEAAEAAGESERAASLAADAAETAQRAQDALDDLQALQTAEADAAAEAQAQAQAAVDGTIQALQTQLEAADRAAAESIARGMAENEGGRAILQDVRQSLTNLLDSGNPIPPDGEGGISTSNAVRVVEIIDAVLG